MRTPAEEKNCPIAFYCVLLYYTNRQNLDVAKMPKTYVGFYIERK